MNCSAGSTMTDMNDEQWLEQIRRGGPGRVRGISGLYRAYSARMKRFFMRHGMLESEAEELVQETFINVVRSCDQFRNDCPVSAWLWKIARNAMYSHFRKSTAEMVDLETLPAEIHATCGALEDHLFSVEDCVANAFDRFATDFRERAEVLKLVAIEGWSSGELAEFLGRTPGAAREYVSQCRKFFRPYVEPCQELLS
ncbi:RNA polymerase sigma factor [Mariprofundus erugo]|uniref:RNA polymerase sigma factor n=1 Tax=Mariprofundus erugo TaxID=2528639 RepID=UPI0010FDDB55|nr:RNA polymerase sigma factor [Mariprofundus erugo]TLS78269.1 RNA polymerase sigma factor [Mariprofundus erugo]